MSKARTVVTTKPTGSTMVCGEVAIIEAKFRFAACPFANWTANSVVMLSSRMVICHSALVEVNVRTNITNIWSEKHATTILKLKGISK